MPGPGAYWIGEEERKEALEVLESGYLFRYARDDIAAFKAKAYTLEKEFADYCEVKHCIATTSGTASLLMSLQALGVGPGDEVIVPAYAFVACYTSIGHLGAVPVLAEIDESLTIDPTDIEKRLTPRTKAIMPVHMLGNACNMDLILEIAKKHGLPVLEDACQGNGGSYHGKKLGSIGSIGAFSLNFFKTITSGDGGLVVTNDTDLFERAFAFHDQGHRPYRTGIEVGNRDILGLNFRIHEVTAAIALAQFRKLGKIVSTLRAKKSKFKDTIGDIPGMKYRRLNDPEGDCATMLTVIFDQEDDAKRVANTLGTATLDHSGWHVYCNMEHVLKYLADRGQPHHKGAYPRTDDILSRSINLCVGVVDSGIGAGFGINIDSSDEDIKLAGDKFRAACSS